MVIGFDRIPQVGCGHKPSSADADYFGSKALLRVMICQVLDHRVGIDDIEAFVAKGERATIEDQRPSVVTPKPANGGQGKTGQRKRPGTQLFYPAASCGGKSIFVRQLRGPHLS